MLTSVAWLNRLLDPPDLSADQAEQVLTFVGFPVESREALPSGDVRLDVELTSNRGDCLCHAGLAREVAAATSRRFRPPVPTPPRTSDEPVASVTSVENRLAPLGCPRFTARVIKGVKVAPSPPWLREALESVGLRPINNVVDVTNFVNLELGHPSHVFDLATLEGSRLIVRHALANESLVALDGRTLRLAPSDMVVADERRAVSLAGIIGGAETGVTDSTRDVLIEMATWDPSAVRRSARRLDIRTDASHRFERVVDARDIDAAALRAAALIQELAGGELCQGMIDAGAPPAPRTVVSFRTERCERLLGIKVPTTEILRLLTSMGVEISLERHADEERLRCLIPPHRHDVSREVDLIEEIARLHGLDKIPVAPALDVKLDLAHPPEWDARERACAAAARAACALGFFETVTFSFVTREHAAMFCPRGLRPLQVDEERRKGAPFLRPSVLPSLLTCRRANQDAQVKAPGGVRLFETASIFADMDEGPSKGRRTVERRVLALLADVPSGLKQMDAQQAGLRFLRGVIETIVGALGGPGHPVVLEPAPARMPACEGESFAGVALDGQIIGYISTLRGVAQQWGIDAGLVGAEVSLDALVALYPPRNRAQEPARFPAIERDLSLVVDESLAWARCEGVVRDAAPAQWLEAVEFLGAYRGKPLDQGKKSISLRLTFRDPSRTLRNEELDEPMQRVMERTRQELNALIRGVDVQ